ncbi:radical SAM family heme chaperone HemW [Endozoicomonadaceae bacterium StTr2]
MLKRPPLSLYIHIPWCVRKCPYCDFNSHAQKDGLPEQGYTEALLADLDNSLPKDENRPLESIFIGGGTPSLFSGNTFNHLLKGVQQRLQFASDIEITMEANPGTVEHDRFAAYREAGINRLSIGVQSFNNDHLTKLGRIHGRDEASNAVALAREAGFDNINLDLMHGLPNQSIEGAMSDLQQAIDLGVEHISWYQLTLEPNTVFHARPPVLPEDETLWGIQEQGQALLASAGFEQYEISAYGRGRQSRHNRNYWQFGDYIGIGAGAHGKLTDIESGLIQRHWKTRQPEKYLARTDSFISGERTLANDELPLEFMMNALRLNQGVPTAYFTERTGIELTAIETELKEGVSRDLLDADYLNRLRPTAKGRLFLNDLLSLFV